MLVVISPAKKLDMDSSYSHTPTQPVFLEHAQELAEVARGLSHDDIRSLMGLSDTLAQLNVERFANFGTQPEKPAALSFAGDTYQGSRHSRWMMMTWPGRKTIYVSCPAFMGCCVHLMPSSPTGWKWAAG